MLQYFGNISSINMFTCFVLVVVVLVTSPPTFSPLHPLRQHFLCPPSPSIFTPFHSLWQHFLFPPTLTTFLSHRRILLWRLMIPINQPMTSQLHQFGSMFDGVAAILGNRRTRLQHVIGYVLISPSLPKLPHDLCHVLVHELC